MTSFYKCWLIFIIFGTQYAELMCNITAIYLLTSLMYCCYPFVPLVVTLMYSRKTVHQGIMRASHTFELLQCETPKFIASDLWPPNSPFLNPVDYRIWCVMQDCVYQTPVPDVTDLKQRLTDTWNGRRRVRLTLMMLSRNGRRDLGLLEGKRRTFWTFAVTTELELTWLCS